MPNLRGEGEGVEFGPSFLPGRVVFGHEGHEPFTVPRLQEVDHLVDDDVLQQVFGLLDQLGVEPERLGLGVAAAPAGLHSLKEIGRCLDAQFPLPLGDQGRDGLMQQGAMPLLHDLVALRGGGLGSDREDEPAVIHPDRGLLVLLDHAEEPAASPDVMAFPFHEGPRRLSGLVLHPALLGLDPGELRGHIGAYDLKPCAGGCDQGHLPIRGVYGQVDVLDRLPGDRDLEVAELDGFRHQLPG